MPQRLDQFVAEKFRLSRSAAREAILLGRVDLEGSRCDEPGRGVGPEAPVTFHPNRPKARKVRSGLVVLHEDDHLLIVDKPPGVLTLPTDRGETGTLLERVQNHARLRYGGRPFIGVVHRLDRDTSGALAFARSVTALHKLQEAFRNHDVERQYLAVVEGAPALDSGTIDRPLTNEPGEVRRRIARGDDEGRPAVTHYQRLEGFGPVASLLACWLETGRTHQIRLHLASIGCPVVGEQMYRPLNQPRCKAKFHRQALHAQTLGLAHPMSGKRVRVEAPAPKDFAALVLDLRNRYGSASEAPGARSGPSEG